MKKFFLFLSLLVCAYLLVACQAMSPYSQLGQPITSTLNLIHDSDNAKLDSSISNPTSTGGNTNIQDSASDV